MPIDRNLYPPDWPAISRRIRDRAGDRCECDGRCLSQRCRAGRDRAMASAMLEASSETLLQLGAEAYAVVRETPQDEPLRCLAVNGQPHPETGSRVVLTVAHLDHKLKDHTDANLAAFCQCCHLAYDRPFRGTR